MLPARPRLPTCQRNAHSWSPQPRAGSGCTQGTLTSSFCSWKGCGHSTPLPAGSRAPLNAPHVRPVCPVLAMRAAPCTNLSAAFPSSPAAADVSSQRSRTRINTGHRQHCVSDPPPWHLQSLAQMLPRLHWMWPPACWLGRLSRAPGAGPLHLPLTPSLGHKTEQALHWDPLKSLLDWVEAAPCLWGAAP